MIKTSARKIERTEKRQRWLNKRRKIHEMKRRTDKRNKKEIRENSLKAAVAKEDDPEIGWTVKNQTQLERELSTEVLTYNHETWNSEFDKDPLTRP
jgi:hypothetical protein